MRFRPLVFASLSAAFSVLACAKEQEDDTFAQRDAFVADFCSIVATCCGQALQQPVTEAACQENVKAFDQKMLEDEKARSACLTQLRAASQKASSNFCAEYSRAEIPACPDPARVANKGDKLPGEPCQSASNCAPSAEGPIECNNGGCQIRRRGKEGSTPCAGTEDNGAVSSTGIVPGPESFLCRSEDGLFCDETSKACVTAKAVGAQCEKSVECVRTAYCNGTSKKCATRKSSESACEESFECQAPYHCEEGFCRNDVEDGGDCTDGAMCRSNSCVDGKCVAAGGKNERLAPVCKAAPAPGG